MPWGRLQNINKGTVQLSVTGSILARSPTAGRAGEIGYLSATANGRNSGMRTTSRGAVEGLDVVAAVVFSFPRLLLLYEDPASQ